MKSKFYLLILKIDFTSLRYFGIEIVAVKYQIRGKGKSFWNYHLKLSSLEVSFSLNFNTKTNYQDCTVRREIEQSLPSRVGNKTAK